MVRLHLLGFTHDLKGLVFTQRRGGKTASFWVPVDDELQDALSKLDRARRDQARTGGGARSTSRRHKDMLDFDELPPAARTRALPPVGRSQPRAGMSASEIQQMLRQGRSTKNVAAAAKTPLSWVERLAEPVLTERMGVVRLAQRAYMQRPRLGTSGLQLGDAVRRNLEVRRAQADTIDSLDAAWDARARASGAWRIWVRFVHRGKRLTAEWEFKKGSRVIAPRNRLAAQLGWWAPEPDAPPPVTDDDDAGDEQDNGSSARPAKPTTAKRRTTRSKRPTRAKRPTARSSKRRPAKKKAARPRARRPQSRRRR